MAAGVELLRQAMGFSASNTTNQENLEGPVDWREDPYQRFLFPTVIRHNDFSVQTEEGGFSSLSKSAGLTAMELGLDAAYIKLGIVLGGVILLSTGVGVAAITAGILGALGARLVGNLAENAIVNRVHGVKLRR